MEKNIKNVLAVLVLLTMFSYTVYVSLHVHIMDALPVLWKDLWFRATILDFYLNQSVIWFITLHLEDYNWKKSIIWIPIYFFLGSMGSAIYFLYYLNFKRNKND